MIPLAAAARDAVIVACAISAGVHAAFVSEHYDESRALGVAFLGSAVVLVALAVALTRDAGPVPLALAGAAFAALLAGYVLAVTAGLPLLHPEPERVEPFAVATKVVEAAGLAAALHLLRRGNASIAAALPSKGALT